MECSALSGGDVYQNPSVTRLGECVSVCVGGWGWVGRNFTEVKDLDFFIGEDC